MLFSGGVVEAGQVGHVDCDVDRMGRHDTAVVPTHWYLRYPLIMAYSSSIMSVSFPHEKSSFMYVAYIRNIGARLTPAGKDGSPKN